jgi:NAD(P)-dependent dehydrogenase (short-subunit alcohol dehydrogenase family)
VRADVSDPAAVALLIDQAQVSFGPISVLVNNAGVLGPIGLFWDVDPDEWWRNLEINLRGPFLCTHAVLPVMISRGRERIANLTSGVAKVPIADATAYGASQTALVRVTESLARDTADPPTRAAFVVSALPDSNHDSVSHATLSHRQAGRRQFRDSLLQSPPLTPPHISLSAPS